MRHSWEELVWGMLALIPAFSPEEKVNRPPLWEGLGLRLQSPAVVSPGQCLIAPCLDRPPFPTWFLRSLVVKPAPFPALPASMNAAVIASR
jgi:hypothetical protein